ncbi:MAG: hypothetical protein L6Q99_00225 [Planctomycetes bacterium]|nr:hypothetical protein [Planctomycetota bacterium]
MAADSAPRFSVPVDLAASPLEPFAGHDAQLPRLERPITAATRGAFVEVVGRRCALLGREEGVFECWIWPLKVAHDLRVTLIRADGTRHALADHAEHVRIDPFELELRHAGPDWRVRLRIFAALDERALVWLFDVAAPEPVTLELELTPDFRPQWPAGLGGQTAGRDDESGGFVLCEELGRFAALCGSPEAEPVRVDADHSLPRGPVRIALPVSVERARAGSLPFFVVGAEVEPAPLSDAARRGEAGAARGEARSHAVLAAVRGLYRRALVEWPRWQAEQAAHWRAFLARTTTLACDAHEHERAFLWAKIAIERAWVEVDGLGRGLVAGLAPSRGGERPGFGWFFDGDALVAARALSRCGAFEFARRVFDFALAHQRDDGKLMHELVLSARLCDWLGDYPYAYYKGVNTPDFLGALGRYVAWSGDVEFLRARWPAVLRAFEHGASCVDERGRYSVRRAGLCAVEAGELVGRMESEIFAHALWLEALLALERVLVPALDEAARRECAPKVAAELARANRALDDFVEPRTGAWRFACLVDGSGFDELTGYHGQVLSLELPTRRATDLATAARLNAPNLAADWGLRMFPDDSSVYDPAHYNTGSVFPYLQDFAIRGLFACGDEGAATQLLRAQVALDGFSGLGFVPEHLVGDRAVAPARGVPHQIFSSSTILSATLAGELGLEVEAGVLRVRPTPTPDRSRFELTQFRVGASVAALELTRSTEGGRTQLVLRARHVAGPPFELEFAPRWPHGSLEASEPFRAHVSSSAVLAASACAGPALFVAPTPLVRGAPSRAPRIARSARDSDGASWTAFGPAGSRARFTVQGERRVAWHGGSLVTPNELEVEFPAEAAEAGATWAAGSRAAGSSGTFVAREVRARFLTP